MWKHSPDVVFRDLEGEAVILDLASGTYFGLNDVGTRVWRLVDEGRDASQIVECGVGYQADRATIARDVGRLLDDLRTRRLIVTVAGTARCERGRGLLLVRRPARLRRRSARRPPPPSGIGRASRFTSAPPAPSRSPGRPTPTTIASRSTTPHAHHPHRRRPHRQRRRAGGRARHGRPLGVCRRPRCLAPLGPRDRLAPPRRFHRRCERRGGASRVCIRDPMGQRPLFYGAAPRAVVFGSEPQQVVRHLGIRTSLDRALNLGRSASP